MGRGAWIPIVSLALAGCAGVRTRAVDPTDELPSSHRFVSFEHGFEIERPPGDEWSFTDGREGPEGIAIPVAVVHAATGSQVVVQVAPDVAPVGEFAMRLARGLGETHGFATSPPRQLAANRAEFTFSVEDRVDGRVGLWQERGRIFVVLGTWPREAPSKVIGEVAAIMESLRPVIVLQGTYAAR